MTDHERRTGTVSLSEVCAQIRRFPEREQPELDPVTRQAVQLINEILGSGVDFEALIDTPASVFGRADDICYGTEDPEVTGLSELFAREGSFYSGVAAAILALPARPDPAISAEFV